MRHILIRVLTVLVVLALLAPSCLADPKAYDFWVVATEPCDVRVEPEADAAVNGMMEKGDEMIYMYDLVIDAEGTVWYCVDAGYNIGWVDSRSVRLLGECGVICEGDRFEVTQDVLAIRATGGDSNIREMPNQETWSLGILKEGDVAVYAGLSYTDDRDVTWYFVEFEDENGEGRDGWVSSKYTTAE